MTNSGDKATRSQILIAWLIIILQGANLVGIAVNRTDIIHNQQKVEAMWKDYVPMWYMEGMQMNNDFRTQEMIIAITKVGPEKQKELNEISRKYTLFQKTMLNQMIQYRGGVTQTTRSGKKTDTNN